MTGGCQCGRARFRAEVEGDAAYLCHCGMCRRATGGFAAALVAATEVAWDGEPDWHASSAIAERPFCGRCGTPLGFRYRHRTNMDLTLGAFDEPGHFRPTEHFSTETALPGWTDTSHLPGRRLDTYEPLARLWEAAGGDRAG